MRKSKAGTRRFETVEISLIASLKSELRKLIKGEAITEEVATTTATESPVIFRIGIKSFTHRYICCRRESNFLEVPYTYFL